MDWSLPSPGLDLHSLVMMPGALFLTLSGRVVNKRHHLSSLIVTIRACKFYILSQQKSTDYSLYGKKQGIKYIVIRISFPGSSDSKKFACNAEDQNSIPGLGRFPGEKNGNPFQHSCLENSMDRGAWRATVHGVTKTERLRLSLSIIIIGYVIY